MNILWKIYDECSRKICKFNFFMWNEWGVVGFWWKDFMIDVQICCLMSVFKVWIKNCTFSISNLKNSLTSPPSKFHHISSKTIFQSTKHTHITHTCITWQIFTENVQPTFSFHSEIWYQNIDKKYHELSNLTEQAYFISNNY